MIGKIIEITENIVVFKLDNNVLNTTNLINTYVAFQDKKIIIGEITNIKEDLVYVNLVGEIINDKFIYGVTTKPSLKSLVFLLDKTKASYILSQETQITKTLQLGYSPIYNDIKINFDINNFFSSHFAILGGTGSGKSWSIATIIQKLFQNAKIIPYKANIFIFDTYGEYHNAFSKLTEINPYITYKSYTTNLEKESDILRIPPHLLDVDDLAILLNATTPEQLKIIEKALELVKIFKQENESILKIKNDIIARAIMDILLSGRPAVQIRDQIFSILAFYKTSDLSLDTILPQPGYNRALKHCLIIDADGKLREMELLTDFFSKFLLDTKEDANTNTKVTYTLKDIENAMSGIPLLILKMLLILLL